jgi:hydrogenase-4 membrane subunit HyfE
MIDYIIISIVSIITCYIVINVFITNKASRIKLNNIKTYLIVLIIGLLVHMLVEYFEINKIYCDKKCLTAIKMLSIK